MQLKYLKQDNIFKLLEFISSTYWRENSPYDTPNPNYVAKKFGYRVLEIRNKEAQDGYYGIAFISDAVKEIIIVHCGTYIGGIKDFFDKPSLKKLPAALQEIKTDIFDDIRFTLNFLPKQPNSAIDFLGDLLQKYSPKDFNFLQIGHSLGGYLAQSSFIYYDMETYVFEAPGAKKFCQHITEFGPTKENLQLNDSPKNNIHYYVSAPNFINSLGQRMITELGIYVFKQPSEYVINSSENFFDLSIKSFSLRSFDEHNITNILNNFFGIEYKYKPFLPETQIDAYKYFLNSKNPYWRSKFDQLATKELPDKLYHNRSEIFKFFCSKYLDYKNLTYLKSAFISNIKFTTLVEGYLYDQHIKSGGYYITYNFKKFYSYLFKSGTPEKDSEENYQYLNKLFSEDQQLDSQQEVTGKLMTEGSPESY